jgi:hypothetical protein
VIVAQLCVPKIRFGSIDGAVRYCVWRKDRYISRVRIGLNDLISIGHTVNLSVWPVVNGGPSPFWPT